MRHLVLLTAFFVSGSATAAEPSAIPSPASPSAVPLPETTTGARNALSGAPCRRSEVHQADQTAISPRASNLADLPNGNLELTVLREVDGCQDPVIVRYNVGNGGGMLPPLRTPEAPPVLRPQRL